VKVWLYDRFAAEQSAPGVRRAARPRERGCQRGRDHPEAHPALREAIAALRPDTQLDRRTRSAAATSAAERDDLLLLFGDRPLMETDRCGLRRTVRPGAVAEVLSTPTCSSARPRRRPSRT